MARKSWQESLNEINFDKTQVIWIGNKRFRADKSNVTADLKVGGGRNNKKKLAKISCQYWMTRSYYS